MTVSGEQILVLTWPALAEGRGGTAYFSIMVDIT